MSVSNNASAFYNSDAIVADYIANKRLSVSADSRVKVLPQTVSWGNDLRFEIPKQGEAYINGVSLNIEIDALTANGGTYIRLINAAGCFIFDTIQVWYGNKQISQVTGLEIYETILEHNGTDEYTLLSRALGIDTDANRTTAAAGKQYLTLHLDELVSLFNVPCPAFLLDDSLTVVFKASTVDKIVSTDGGAPPTPNATAWLSVTYSECLPCAQYDKKNGYKVLYEVERIRQDWTLAPNGTTQYNVNLLPLKDKDVVMFNICVRLAADVTTAYARNNTNFQRVDNFQLNNSTGSVSGVLFPITDWYYRNQLLRGYSFLGMAQLLTRNLYAISYSKNLDQAFADHSDRFLGSRHFGEDANTLQINMPTVPTGNIQITCSVVCAKRMIMGGKQRTIMHVL